MFFCVGVCMYIYLGCKGATAVCSSQKGLLHIGCAVW